MRKSGERGERENGGKGKVRREGKRESKERVEGGRKMGKVEEMFKNEGEEEEEKKAIKR